MGVSYTLPANVPYPVPYPTEPDYDYPYTFADMAHIIDRIAMSGAETIIAVNAPSSGTISTTELRILGSQTITLARAKYYPFPAQVAVSLSAICASIETTATTFVGYVRAEIWQGGSLFSSSDNQWFGQAHQGHVSLKFILDCPYGTGVEARFYSAARTTTNRFKMFESRFPTAVVYTTNISYRMVYGSWND